MGSPGEERGYYYENGHQARMRGPSSHGETYAAAPRPHRSPRETSPYDQRSYAQGYPADAYHHSSNRPFYPDEEDEKLRRRHAEMVAREEEEYYRRRYAEQEEVDRRRQLRADAERRNYAQEHQTVSTGLEIWRLAAIDKVPRGAVSVPAGAAGTTRVSLAHFHWDSL